MSKLPVEKNKYYEVTFEDLTHDGSGVGKVGGFPIFVKNGIPGEKAVVKAIKVKKTYAYGRLMEIVEESDDRVEPPCPIFKQCGGCQLQHISYEWQLKFKRKQVIDVLERIGGLTDATVHPVLGMDEPWYYRNKSQVPIGEEKGNVIAGFYASGTHRIVDMETCFIQQKPNDEVVQFVKTLANKYGIKPYDEEKHRGILRHVVVRYGHVTKDVMVIFITNGGDFPHKKKLIEEIVEKIPNVKSIVQNVNTKKTNVIFGEKTKVLWGDDVIYDFIGDVKFAISARSFYQVNPVQTKVLYEKALEYADLTGSETVIDAYCGIGTISLFLAQKARKVYGVEIVPEAVSDAKRNARLNGMDNAEFAVGEAEKVIPWWYAQGVRADVVVVDPPRKGCDEALLETIVKMKPERVVYVSCNPATLARDLKYLTEHGFTVEEVQPVDMFPHTSHVECCVKLIKN